MREERNILQEPDPNPQGAERGQSIVLIAVLMIGLVAFAGLVVDAGFLFARNSQFSAAVDAAALAGVVELHQTGVTGAIERGNQFLSTNGWPVTSNNITGTQSLADVGIPQFTLTATWPVETFFLRIIGFDTIGVTHSATAAYYARTDLTVPSVYDQGVVQRAGQFVFGPDACTTLGDPISPHMATNSEPNPTYERTDGRYTYRISVPPDYVDDTGQSLVRIQLFDPDSWNDVSRPLSFERTDGSTGSGSCNSGSGGAGEPCIIETGDRNSTWLVRVDQTYTDSTCPSPNPGSPFGNTVTVYELYYLDEDDNRVDLASFDSSTAPVAATDMKWVTPGLNGIPADGGSFEVDILGIPQDMLDNYNIYLDVRTTDGTSKNVWDLWAGPPAVAATLPADVNSRNLNLLRTGTYSSTMGISAYAEGYMPLDIYPTDLVEVPLGAVAQDRGGTTIYTSVFDFEGNVAVPFVFTMDKLSDDDFKTTAAANCSDGCNYHWVRPQIEMGIPTVASGVAFYGGTIMVEYEPNQDDHTWSMVITSGRPFLTR